MAEILVVEDEESLLQTLRYNLTRAGHDVRGKIAPDPALPQRIQTIRGLGYVFQE